MKASAVPSVVDGKPSESNPLIKSTTTKSSTPSSSPSSFTTRSITTPPIRECLTNLPGTVPMKSMKPGEIMEWTNVRRNKRPRSAFSIISERMQCWDPNCEDPYCDPIVNHIDNTTNEEKQQQEQEQEQKEQTEALDQEAIDNSESTIEKDKQIDDTTTIRGSTESLSDNETQDANPTTSSNCNSEKCSENICQKSTIITTKNIQHTSRIKDETPTFQTYKGKALFCLHSLGCKWFQGQFFPSSSSISNIPIKVPPIGLLAIENESIDRCLACADGGYKELQMTLLSSSSSSSSSSSTTTMTALNNEKVMRETKKQQQYQFHDLVCTGGDMLYIRSSSISSSTDPFMTTPTAKNDDNDDKTIIRINNELADTTESSKEEANFSFVAEKIITGTKIISPMKQYFSNILQQVSDNPNDVMDDHELTQLLPDCAIVVGTLVTSLPYSFVRRGQERDESFDLDDERPNKRQVLTSCRYGTDDNDDGVDKSSNRTITKRVKKRFRNVEDDDSNPWMD